MTNGFPTRAVTVKEQAWVRDGSGSGARQAVAAMRVKVIQSLESKARSSPQVRMQCKHKMGNCACKPKKLARGDGFANCTAR
eukprot:6199767-Pleurochrysis_carterae.AAC.1